MRQGTARTVPGLSLIRLSVLRSSSGSAPKLQRVSLFANGMIGTAQREGGSERAWNLRRAGRDHGLTRFVVSTQVRYSKRSQFGGSFKFEVSSFKQEKPRVRLSPLVAGRSCGTNPIRGSRDGTPAAGAGIGFVCAVDGPGRFVLTGSRMVGGMCLTRRFIRG
jgi:hypothetical protein